MTPEELCAVFTRAAEGSDPADATWEEMKPRVLEAAGLSSEYDDPVLGPFRVRRPRGAGKCRECEPYGQKPLPVWPQKTAVGRYIPKTPRRVPATSPTVA